MSEGGFHAGWLEWGWLISFQEGVDSGSPRVEIRNQRGMISRSASAGRAVHLTILARRPYHPYLDQNLTISYTRLSLR